MKRTFVICSCFVAAALVLAASPAAAQGPGRISEENGPRVEREIPIPAGGGNLLLLQPPNGLNGLFSESAFPQAIAENFLLNVDQDIVFLEWFGGFFPAPVGNEVGVFQIEILNDAGDLPDPSAVKCSFKIEVTGVPTGVILFGVPELQYALGLPVGDCNLLGGAVYWLVIVNNNADPGGNVWFWETGDVDPNKGIPGIAFSTDGKQTWMPDPNDMAITIVGQDKDQGGPPNDTCDTKVQVDCDTITSGTNIGATDEDDEDCPGGTSFAGASVWYSIDVPFDAEVTASFCKDGSGADFDTVLDVYDGGCDALNCIAGNDDTCSLQSEVTWQADAGGRYEMRVSGFSSAEGVFDLAVNCVPKCDGIELDGPAKATAGEKFNLDISCANPDSRILVAGGRNDEGSARFVPGCGVVEFGIGPRPNNFGTTMADGDGNATSSQTLGDNFGNSTIYYQVLDQSKCEVSNVLEVFVNKAGEGGGTLYGTTNVPAQLFTIDVTTGAGTLVGILNDVCGFGGSTEIEYDNTTGRAFSQSPNGSFCGYEFDISDASGIGGPIPNVGAYQGIEVVDGTWYGACFAGGCGNELHTFDPFTGTFTLVGPTGVGPISGLAWDGTTMYAHAGGGVQELYTIDLVTGAATLVGPTGIVAGSLQFGPDGLLYAGGGQVNAGDLYRLDTATGASTLVGPTGFTEPISGLTLVED